MRCADLNKEPGRCQRLLPAQPHHGRDGDHAGAVVNAELPQRAAGTRPDVNGVAGHAGPARLQIQFGLDLLPGNRVTRLVHGGVGLGGVLSVLGRAESIDE